MDKYIHTAVGTCLDRIGRQYNTERRLDEPDNLYRVRIINAMPMAKDWNSLRPFDLETAKRGEPIVFADGTPVAFIAEGGTDGHHAIRNNWGNVVLATAKSVRMAPLCWVEDRPVYKGDVLCWDSTPLTIVSDTNDPNWIATSDGIDRQIRYATWNKPQIASTLTADEAMVIVNKGRDRMKAKSLGEELENPFTQSVERLLFELGARLALYE